MKTLIRKYNWLAILSVFGLLTLLVLDKAGFVDKQELGIYIQIPAILFPLIAVLYTLYLFYDCLTNPAVNPKIGWAAMFLLFAPIAAVFCSISEAYKEQSTMLEQLKNRDNF